MATGDKLVNLDALKAVHDADAAEVADLKSAIDAITGNTVYDGWSATKKAINTSGTTADINSPITTTADFRYLIVDCSEKDIFTVTATGGSSPRAWAFLDSSGNVLSKADSNASVTGLILTAPANATKLVINDSSLLGSVYGGELIGESVERLVDDVDELQEKFVKYTEIDLNTHIYNAYINTSNKWSSSTTAKCSLQPIPSGVVGVKIAANDSYGANIAFLTDNSHEGGATPSYVDGTSRIMLSAGETKKLSVPTNAAYLYVLKIANNGNVYTPDSVMFGNELNILALDSTLTQEGEAADAKVTGDRIENIINLADTEVPFTIAFTINHAINCNTGALYTANANFGTTGYVDVEKYSTITYRRIVVTLANAPQHGMAFYDSSYNYVSGVRSGYGESAVAGYEDKTIDVPPTAKYARFTIRDSETYGDFYIIGENVLKSNISSMISNQEKNNDAEGCEWLTGLVGMTQKTNGKFNVVSRMRLLCDTEWTPLAPVPRQKRVNGSLVYDSFPIGEKQKGIPYGAQLTYEQWLGKNISIETFLSALANPNSVIYDFSRVGTAYRASAWYSVNCSKAVVYALNLRNTYASGTFASDPNISIIANAGEFTAEDIQIGDIIESIGVHTAFVTDLVYNTFGELSQIEVSEAVTPTCRRKRWNIYGSFENFFDHFAGYRLERYTLIDSVPPINMEAMYPYISTSIGLNYGNKSNYTTADTIEITLFKKISNTLVVKKAGTQVDTIDVTDYAQSSIVQYTQSTAGWYEIGFDGDDEKNWVGFCVNDNIATFDSSTNKLTFSSSESVLFMVSYSDGSARSHIGDVFPTSTDLANGYMTLTVPASADYIHATFANDYGKTIIEIALS